MMRRLLDLLFPPRCIFCGRLALPGEPRQSCRRCLAALPRTVTPRYGTAPRMAVAPFLYVGGVRRALLRFKFQGKTSYAAPLARFMAAEALRRYRDTPELVVFAPVSAARRRRRGYDQSELLAEEVASLLSLPLAPALEKVRDTPAQSSLHASQRMQNVRGSYRCALPGSIAGKRVLLVDDVCTTGSTMGECARVLMAAGAAEVYGLALAFAGEDN